jgi:hypothetical protein
MSLFPVFFLLGQFADPISHFNLRVPVDPDGLTTRTPIRGSTSESPMAFRELAFQNVILNTTCVQLSTSSVVVLFRLPDQADCSMIVAREFDPESPVCRTFDGIGLIWFRADVSSTSLYQSCSLVKNVSTYWIGLNEELASDDWMRKDVCVDTTEGNSCEFSWQNLSIQSGASATVGVIFQTGPSGSGPRLTLPVKDDHLDSLQISGTIDERFCCLLGKTVSHGVHELVLSSVDDPNGRVSDGVSISTARISDSITTISVNLSRTSSEKPTSSQTPTPRFTQISSSPFIAPTSILSMSETTLVEEWIESSALVHCPSGSGKLAAIIGSTVALSAILAVTIAVVFFCQKESLHGQ